MAWAVHPGEIHVWRVPLASDAPPATIEACRRLLSADECARADRFRTEPLRAAFVLCHGSVRRILAKYTDVVPAALEFDLEAHGKPVLREASTAAAGTALHFNLSHSADLALVGIGAEPIGIDVERVRPMPDADRLARRFFAPAEYAAFCTTPAGERTLAFFRCWTRKEAFVKAIGEGLSHPLAGFTVSLHPTASALLDVAGAPDEAAEWSLAAFEPADGYLAAAAVRRRDARLSFFELPF